jgi:putative DNA primase/helicase
MNAADFFRETLLEAGLQLLSLPVDDGGIHRVSCACKSSGDENGWYRFRAAPVPRGWFGCWRCHPEPRNWSAKSARTLTGDEQRQLEEEARRLAAEERERQREISGKVQTFVDKFPEARPDHPYLVRKQVKPYGAKVMDRGGEPLLMLPLQDAAGKIWSCQAIFPNGDKLFERGGRIKGCFFVIGQFLNADRLIIAEGFATGASIHEATRIPVLCAMSAGNLAEVAMAVRQTAPLVDLVIAADNDQRTQGNPGVTKAREAALAVSAKLAIASFPETTNNISTESQSLTDYNDLACSASLAEVGRQLAEAARPPGWQDHLPDWLSKLSKAQYETVRSHWSDESGWRTSILDELTEERRGPTSSPAVETGDARWPEPVDGAELLDLIESTFRRFLILPDHAAEVIALFVVHTYAFNASGFTPYLCIVSPAKRCGKTRVLDVLTAIVREPLSTGSATAAALFRLIESTAPTLLIDEFDAMGEEQMDAVRAVLNMGFKAGGFVHRCVGDDHEVKAFACFCPKVLAGIGKLPDTVMDRSIVVTLRRKLKTEKVERFRHFDGSELSAKCARWTADKLPQLETAAPFMPDGLNDRQEDIWEPLIAIADAAGGDWPRKARDAAKAFAGDRPEDDQTGIELLRDIAKFLEEDQGVGPIPSKDLIANLVAIEESRWSAYGKRGDAITPQQLARLLKPFGVAPRSVRIGEVTAKGYDRDALQEIIGRYLDPKSSKPEDDDGTPAQPA